MSDAGNRYEDRLGTDRMLPLVFRMALPSVVAQIVNLLYNIVDRIFIGRIPGIGTDALAGVGVTGSVIILISAFSMIVGGGAAPLASIALGQAKISLFIALLRKVFLLVPLALLLPRFFGVEGVYLAESVADATAALCCITIFALTFPKILAKGCREKEN